jgi:hypothetical protein
MKNNKTDESHRAVADLIVADLPEGSLAFISAQYTEITNGVLPRLVADFICDVNKFPLDLSNVTLNLRIEEDLWEIKANVDSFRFITNVVTIFFSLAPKDFYFKSRSAKFKSPTEAINSLYFGEKIDSNIKNNTVVELNQVATSDYKYLNNILRSMNSPSVFAYTLNSLNIKNLNTKGSKLKIDPKRVSYYIDDQEKEYSNDSLLEASPTTIGVMSNNSSRSSSLLEWGGIKVTYNESVSDLISNVVNNTVSIKKNKLSLRLTSQKNLYISSGDIVTIDLPNLDLTRFLVVERLAIIGAEIKFNYKLKGID